MAQKTDLGMVQIRNEVVGTIAALAAQEVQGVAEIWRGIFPLLPWGRNLGVWVQIQDQEVRVALNLVAEYGVSLPQVAVAVQGRVREMIERMTNLSTVEVHVSIHHVKPKRSVSK